MRLSCERSARSVDIGTYIMFSSHLEDGPANNEREQQITDVPACALHARAPARQKCLFLYTSIRPLFGRIISVLPEASFL